MEIFKGLPDDGEFIPQGKAKYPWSEMEVGDMFFAKLPSTSISATALYQNNKGQKKFKVRTGLHKGEKGTWVIRIT